MRKTDGEGDSLPLDYPADSSVVAVPASAGSSGGASLFSSSIIY